MTQRKTATDPPVKVWLRGRLGSAGRWIGLSIFLGTCGGLLVVAQAYCVAGVIHGAFVDKRQLSQMSALFTVLVGIIAGRAVIAWGRERAGFAAGAAVRRQVRQEIVDHLFYLGPVVGGQIATGRIVTMAMEQVEALQAYYAQYLPQFFLALFIPAAVLIFVFPLSWVAGLILLATAPLIPLFMVLVGMGAESINQRHFQSLARMSAHFLDTLQGITVLKIFDRSKKEGENLARVSAQYRRKTMAVLRIAFLSSAVLEFFSAMAIAIVAVYLGLGFLGYYQFGSYGMPLSFHQGFFILLLSPEFYLPLKELGGHYHARAGAVGAAEEILKVLRMAPDTIEETGKKIVLASKDGLNLRFEAVSVDYGRGRKVLDAITLKIDAGQRVAVVGPSGAGKSTLIHLLLGFVQPSSGDIRVNAIPLSELALHHWRKQLAWIGQHPVLFCGSIADNIRMACPAADESAVVKAASAAGVMAFCAHLPRGLDTILGEQGLGLSKGQAQRVALARAYLKKAPLVLLDEPTAGLDDATEQHIIKAAAALFKNQTVLMATHSEAAAAGMDWVIRLEAGRLIDIVRNSTLKDDTCGNPF